MADVSNMCKRPTSASMWCDSGGEIKPLESTEDKVAWARLSREMKLGKVPLMQGHGGLANHVCHCSKSDGEPNN